MCVVVGQNFVGRSRMKREGRSYVRESSNCLIWKCTSLYSYDSGQSTGIILSSPGHEQTTLRPSFLSAAGSWGFTVARNIYGGKQ